MSDRRSWAEPQVRTVAEQEAAHSARRRSNSWRFSQFVSPGSGKVTFVLRYYDYDLVLRGS